MSISEVPSPIDFKRMRDCVEWERSAMARPFRSDFFEAITRQLRHEKKPDLEILELGSGPGFLALYLLDRLPDVRLALLDFSPAMHELAAKRLVGHLERVRFIERDLKSPAWPEGLGAYDAVVTVQAVHELRHKLYAEALHRQVRDLLRNGGSYLVCDHYCGADGQQNDQLYMTIAEQRACLAAAGYAAVTDILIMGGRSLYRAMPEASPDSGL